MRPVWVRLIVDWGSNDDEPIRLPLCSFHDIAGLLISPRSLHKCSRKREPTPKSAMKASSEARPQATTASIFRNSPIAFRPISPAPRSVESLMSERKDKT